MSNKSRSILIIVTVVLLSLVVAGIVYLVVTPSGQEPGLATSPKDDSQTQSGSTPEAQVASTPQPGSGIDLTFLTLDTPSSLKLVVEQPSLAIEGSIRQDALLTIGNDIVEPNLEGRFSHTVGLKPGHNIVEVLASTSSGEKNSLVLAVIHSP